MPHSASVHYKHYVCNNKKYATLTETPIG